MSEKQIGIPDEIPNDIVVKQIDEAIRFIAYMENKKEEDVFVEIKGIDVITERWVDDYMGIYAVIYFKTGEKCTIPLVYKFEGKLVEATMPHMFSDGECEF